MPPWLAWNLFCMLIKCGPPWLIDSVHRVEIGMPPSLVTTEPSGKVTEVAGQNDAEAKNRPFLIMSVRALVVLLNTSLS